MNPVRLNVMNDESILIEQATDNSHVEIQFEGFDDFFDLNKDQLTEFIRLLQIRLEKLK